MKATAAYVMIAACTAAATARADVVSAQGRAIAVDVKITALKDGLIVYQSDAGVIQRPIEDIRYLQISGWDAFNQAEKQLRDGQTRLAMTGYENLLAGSFEADAAGGLDRRLLVQCRLLRLYQAQGDFVAAVRMYLAVLQAMPTTADALRPLRLPKRGPELEAAAKLVDQAIAARDLADPVAVSLEKWRATWPDKGGAAGRKPTTRPAAANTPPTAGGASTPTGAELKTLVDAGRFDEALKLIRKTAEAAAGVLPPEVWYWQGRAYLGLAGQSKTKTASADRRRAGLAFMRVVITAPGGPLAAECLYRAGEACRDEGRPAQAVTLWTELLATYPTATPWARQAQAELAKIKATTTAPSE